VLLLTISLYMPILETNSRQWLGKDYLELRAWCDQVNSKGVDIQAGEWGEDFQPIYSDEYPTPGQIIKYACYYGTSDLADGCGRPLTANSRINYQRSLGPKTNTRATLTQDHLASAAAIVNFCNTNKMACAYEPKDMSDGIMVKVKVNGNTYTNKDYFQEVIPAGTHIDVYYNEEYGVTKPASVLTNKDLSSLTTINTFCNSSAASCTFEVVDNWAWYAPTDDHVSVQVTNTETGMNEGVYFYEYDFQLPVDNNHNITVYYCVIPKEKKSDE
jgi:hypothetical protein